MFRSHFCCRKSLLSVAVVLFSFTCAHAQCNPHSPNPPSPAEQASVTLNGKDVTIYYCSPSMKGRKVFGELVPYGKVWRTGANSATTLKTQATLHIGNLVVPAGTYTLYTLPEQQGWKLIVNKQTGQWGTVYNQDQDLGRVDMMEGVIPASPVEKFVIDFQNTQGNKTELHLKWEKTDVYVPITATD
ncbi:MAG: DUF2911 domain-containing protein [Acidobacteriaceae bacterium]|nr:DUF2911 domain-containing protein [Acidobacteriaceae bacterium]